MLGSILNTVTGAPFSGALASVPVSPSNGWPAGDTLPEPLYRKPSMWSKDRFSSISTTTCWIVDKLVPGVVIAASVDPRSWFEVTLRRSPEMPRNGNHRGTGAPRCAEMRPVRSRISV